MELLREVPMRLPLVVIALIAGFILWDQFGNDGAYSAYVQRSFRLASADLPGSGGWWKPPTITLKRDALKP